MGAAIFNSQGIAILEFAPHICRTLQIKLLQSRFLLVHPLLCTRAMWDFAPKEGTMQKAQLLAVVAVAVLLLGVRAGAQPDVDQINGDLVHQGQVEIFGTGFGQKTPAAPMVYDNFEGGTPGTRIGGGWYTDSARAGYYPTYSNAMSRRVNGQSARLNFTDGNYNSTLALVHLEELTGDPQSPLYVSGWFYNTTTGAPSRNVKLISFRGGGAGAMEAPELRCDFYPSTSGGHIYAVNCDDTDVMQDWGLGNQMYSNAWHRLEAYEDVQTGYTLWRDNEEWVSINTVLHDPGCYFRNLYLMHYFATDTGTPRPSMEFYWDELYIDITKARVELGDASTWSSCTHREVQIPTAWSSDSITINVNQGSFQNAQQAYLYVVDSNGAVNQQGLPVTLGGTFQADTLPTITILQPTSNATYTTNVATLALSGTASDDHGLLSVTWQSDRSGSGVALNSSGDWTAWTTGQIPLLSGVNVIRLIATDTGSQTRDDTITVTYTPDPGPPGAPSQPDRLGS
jgi:hypothetical protein